jgi:hypothetical protein
MDTLVLKLVPSELLDKFCERPVISFEICHNFLQNSQWKLAKTIQILVENHKKNREPETIFFTQSETCHVEVRAPNL